MTLQLAVVLPTFNERKNLRSMVERLDKALAGIRWEAIVVDDNSPDGTANEARAISLEDPRLRVVERIGRRGLASAAIDGRRRFGIGGRSPGVGSPSRPTRSTSTRCRGRPFTSTSNIAAPSVPCASADEPITK